MELLAYGTLREPEVISTLTGRTYESEDVVLPGYLCRRLKGRVYPGMMLWYGDEVPATLYYGVDEDAVAVLDYFEDEIYDRTQISVKKRDGRMIEALAYLIPESRGDLLSDEPWDRERFRQQCLNEYLKSCQRLLQQWRARNASPRR